MLNSRSTPNEGDIIFTAWKANNKEGRLYCLDPGKAAYTTLAKQTVGNSFLYQIAMAEDNNRLVASQTDSGSNSSALVWFTPGGIATTTIGGIPGCVTGLELDGDDTWVVSSDPGGIHGVNRTSKLVSTYVTPKQLPGVDFQGVTIVREGGVKYAVINSVVNFSRTTPKLFAADRTGRVVTLYSSVRQLEDLYDIKYVPMLGQIMTSDGGARLAGNTEVCTVTLSGAVTTFASFGDPEGIHVMRDKTAYVIGEDPVTRNTITKYDLATRTALKSYYLPPSLGPNFWACFGITTYGSRVLCCSGKGGPAQQIAVNIQSHRAAAAGAGYQLACALTRRPGIKMPNGEWLMLNPSDPLFALTATNQVGPIFQGFAGTLDAAGHASAKIQLPANFPSNLRITVFCAGVIYGTAGVIQATNTHWFEL